MSCAAQPGWGGWLGSGEPQRARAGGGRSLCRRKGSKRISSRVSKGRSSRGSSKEKTRRDRGRKRRSNRNRETSSRGNRGKTTRKDSTKTSGSGYALAVRSFGRAVVGGAVDRAGIA